MEETKSTKVYKGAKNEVIISQNYNRYNIIGRALRTGALNAILAVTMNGISWSYLTGKIEYLEKNLNLLKKEISQFSKKPGKKVKIYGSLPKIGLTLSDFKNVRKSLSSSWEQEWS